MRKELNYSLADCPKTFKCFSDDFFTSYYCRHSATPESFNRDWDLFDRYFLPGNANMPMDDFDTARFDSILKDLLEDGHTRTYDRLANLLSHMEKFYDSNRLYYGHTFGSWGESALMQTYPHWSKKAAEAKPAAEKEPAAVAVNLASLASQLRLWLAA